MGHVLPAARRPCCWAPEGGGRFMSHKSVGLRDDLQMGKRICWVSRHQLGFSRWSCNFYQWFFLNEHASKNPACDVSDVWDSEVKASTAPEDGSCATCKGMCIAKGYVSEICLFCFSFRLGLCEDIQDQGAWKFYWKLRPWQLHLRRLVA